MRSSRGELTRQTSSTPGRLRAYTVLILLLTGALWMTTNAVVSYANRTITSMGDKSAPAVVAAAQAQSYVAYADAARAYHRARYGPGAATLGQPYLSAKKMGVKELGQALADNTSGRQGEYLIRSAQKNLSGYARLPYASRFMHSPKDGILHKIGKARALNRDVFATQRSSLWLSPIVIIFYLAVAVVLLMVLFRTQMFLRRRFRRRLSLPLLVTAGLVVALCAWTTAQVLHTHYALQSGKRSLNQVVALLRVQTVVAESYGAELSALASDHGRRPGQRSEELVSMPLTAPLVPPLGVGNKIGTVTSTRIDVPRVLRRWTRMPTQCSNPAAMKQADYFCEYVEADRRLNEDRNLDAAALNEATQELHDKAVKLRGSISRRVATDKQQLDTSMQAAGLRFGLDLGIPVLVLSIVIATMSSVGPRLNEYHGWRDSA